MNYSDSQYRTLLKTLSVDKDSITQLSILAQNHGERAKEIVTAISDAVKMAPNTQKIAFFYLMDSILKNVGGPYVPLLEERFLRLMPPTYQAVTAGDKEGLRKVLKSWKLNATGYLFPAATLRKLDEFFEAIDKPTTAIPSASRPRPVQNVAASNSQSTQSLAIVTSSILHLLQQVLIEKEHASRLSPNNNEIGQHIFALKQLMAVVSSGSVGKDDLIHIQNQVMIMKNSVPQQSYINQGPFLAKTAIPFVHHQSYLPNPAFQTNAFTMPPPQPQQFVPSLPTGFSIPQGLSFALDSFATNSNIGTANALNSTGVVPRMSKDIPIIRLEADQIARSHPGLSFHLYEAIDLQCRQCALRFSKALDGPDAKQILDAHLDWHFRQKKRLRDKGKKTVSRDWYLVADEWVAEQPIESISENQVAPVFFNQDDDQSLLNKDKVSSIPAGKTLSKCEVCQELLEKFYDEDADKWMLKGAIQIYHQECFNDSSSIASNTPRMRKRSLGSEDGYESGGNLADLAKKVKIEKI